MPEIWFYIKKAISWFPLPLGQLVILWLVGGLLWWRRPHLRIGPILCLLGSLLLLAYSTPVVSGLLFHGLERENLHYVEATQLRSEGIKYIVVLSGGSLEGTMNTTDRLNEATLKRTLEGLRLWAHLRGTKLVLSGGNIRQLQSQAKDMEIFSRQIKPSKGTIILETSSLDTDDQAKNLSALLGKAKFALVTSAFHMPRSLKIFRAHGMNPIPAPADFRTKGLEISIDSFVPQPWCFADSQRAIKEYVGLLWEEMKGLFSHLILNRGSRD